MLPSARSAADLLFWNASCHRADRIIVISTQSPSKIVIVTIRSVTKHNLPQNFPT